MLKRGLEAAHVAQPGEQLSSPPRRTHSPSTPVHPAGRLLVPAAIQHPTYVADFAVDGKVRGEELDDQEPPNFKQGGYSTHFRLDSFDDEYDQVFDAASECNSSGSETGSMFGERIDLFRQHYAESRPQRYVDRQAAIARCRRNYMAQWKATYSPEERQTFTIRFFSLELIGDEEHTYQPTEEECVLSFLALARFARLSAVEMRQGVEDSKTSFAEW